MVALGRDAAVAARLLTTYTPTLRVAKSVEPVALRRAGPAADEAVGAGVILDGRGRIVWAAAAARRAAALVLASQPALQPAAQELLRAPVAPPSPRAPQRAAALAEQSAVPLVVAVTAAASELAYVVAPFVASGKPFGARTIDLRLLLTGYSSASTDVCLCLAVSARST